MIVSLNKLYDLVGVLTIKGLDGLNHFFNFGFILLETQHPINMKKKKHPNIHHERYPWLLKTN